MDKIGNRMGYLWGRARLGYVLLRDGQMEEGLQILRQTTEEFQSDRGKIGLAFALEKMAYYFCRSGMPERAAQLIGWSEKTRDETGEVRPKLEQMDLDRDLAFCVSQLGQDAVNVALDQGRAMTLDEAAALALADF
jgi:hypothetical protein